MGIHWIFGICRISFGFFEFFGFSFNLLTFGFFLGTVPKYRIIFFVVNYDSNRSFNHNSAKRSYSEMSIVRFHESVTEGKMRSEYDSSTIRI